MKVGSHFSSSVYFFSSESKQHGDTQWWDMSTASFSPPHRPDLYVLRQRNNAIYVCEQVTHNSIKMAHQTYLYLYLSLYMYMVVMSCKCPVMVTQTALKMIRDEDEVDFSQTYSGYE